jgi:APA family basic amino acid/polyamine antiporter
VRLAAAAHLIGRAAVAATAAGVFGMHVLPTRPVATAVAVIVVTTGLAVAGVACTARAAWALVGGIGIVLLVVVLVGLSAAGRGGPDVAASAATQVLAPVGPASEGAPGVLTAAGLLFFAYAGFARLFPLGPQLRPARGRRVVGLTLGIALAVHLGVAAALLLGLGVEPLAADPAPLVALVDTRGAPALGVLVRVGAAVACGSVLLSALVGWGATAAAMAARGELPRWMGAGPRGRPWRADLAGGVVAAVVVVVAGPVGALALAACALLVHYALVGLAAVLLPPERRSWPVAVPVAGALLCLLLALLLPLRPVAATAVLVAVLWVLATLHARRAAPL